MFAAFVYLVDGNLLTHQLLKVVEEHPEVASILEARMSAVTASVPMAAAVASVPVVGRPMAAFALKD